MGKEHELLKQAIAIRKKEGYVGDYEATDEEALGVLISQHFEWIGDKIFETCMEGLTDSNYHAIRKKLEDTWKKWKEESDI